MHRKIEEYALNAWPAIQTLIYDGWLLRFADGYTKRANSVNALYDADEDDLARNIPLCEALYQNVGLNSVFKITPFAPSVLDEELAARGYTIVEPSFVMILDDLEAVAKPDPGKVELTDVLTQKWTDTFASLSSLSGRNRAAMERMLSHTVLQTGYFILYEQSVPVACGLGVIEDKFVGLFDIITSKEHRNRGHGERLIRNILQWAKEKGAKQGYLQVVQDNLPANRLYAKLGYRHLYDYWYRSKTFS